MTSTQNNQPTQYSPHTLKRADRALRCSPFQLALFTAMGSASVPLPKMSGQTGQAQGYTQKPLSERRVEQDLVWLIDVGLLRREVDGQGITDSFRLTPLGRQLVEKWERQKGMPIASGLERLLNALNRWLRLPM